MVCHNSPKRRHIAYGFFLLLFSIFLMSSQAAKSKNYFSGYWVGGLAILSAVNSIVCGYIASKASLIFTCCLDTFIATFAACGFIVSVVFLPDQVIVLFFSSAILVSLLIIHALVVFDELGICGHFMSCARSEDQAIQPRDLDNLSQPIDFALPHELSKPPDYDQISIRGAPPEYGSSSLQPQPVPSSMLTHQISRPSPPPFTLTNEPIGY